MLLRNLLALFLLTASTSILADTVDLNLRDSAVQLQYIAPTGRDTLGSTDLHAGLLYTDNSGKYGDIGILVKGPVGNRDSGITAGVGVKGVVATVNDFSTAALAIGGQMRFSLPPATRLGIVGELYFSPNIVTYRDAERFVEAAVRTEYELIPQASAYIGYRRISFSLVNKTDAVLDTGFNAGVRISF
jgi:hypothetical protein